MSGIPSPVPLAFQVLVVEDDPLVVSYLCLALSNLNLAFTTCDTLRTARAYLQAQSFDLLLLDWMLPDGAAADLLFPANGSRWRWPDCKVLVLSGLAREQLPEAGPPVDLYLPKSVSVETLRSQVQGLLGGHRVCQERGLALASPAPDGGCPLHDDNFGGDEELFEAFRELSLKQLPQDLSNLEQAIEARAFGLARRLAHSLKTVLRLLRQTPLAEQAAALEAAALAETIGEMEAQWDRLSPELLRLIQSDVPSVG